jgi:hypothetical protein
VSQDLRFLCQISLPYRFGSQFLGSLPPQQPENYFPCWERKVQTSVAVLLIWSKVNFLIFVLPLVNTSASSQGIFLIYLVPPARAVPLLILSSPPDLAGNSVLFGSVGSKGRPVRCPLFVRRAWFLFCPCTRFVLFRPCRHAARVRLIFPS